MNPAICPQCGNKDENRVAGHEVQGVYDGVLYWSCGVCQHAWPRWTHEGHKRRAELAERFATLYNQRIAGLACHDDPSAGNINVAQDCGRRL